MAFHKVGCKDKYDNKKRKKKIEKRVSTFVGLYLGHLLTRGPGYDDKLHFAARLLFRRLKDLKSMKPLLN